MGLAEKIQQLYLQFGQMEGVDIELHKQLIAVAVNNGAAKATIFLQGAQLAEYVPAGQKPVIWLSETCDYQKGTPLRGGIPICWPWFGDLAKNPSSVKDQYSNEDLPAHGFVRSREWELEQVNIVDASTTEVTLSLDVPADDLWPFDAKLTLTITVAETLKLTFSVRNTGSKAFSFTSALHTYFKLGHIDNVKVIGLEGVTYIDTLNDWAEVIDDQPVSVSAETDRIYKNVDGSVRLHDADFNRDISLSSTASPDLVFWNPWIEKSKRLSHFPDDAYLNMLCLESANVLGNECTLAPQASFETEMTIGLESK